MSAQERDLREQTPGADVQSPEPGAAAAASEVRANNYSPLPTTSLETEAAAAASKALQARDERLRVLYLRHSLPEQTVFEQARFQRELEMKRARRGTPRALRLGLGLGVALAALVLAWLVPAGVGLNLPAGQAEVARVGEGAEAEAEGYPRWLALTADASAIVAPENEDLAFAQGDSVIRDSEIASEITSEASAASSTEEASDAEAQETAKAVAIAKVMTEDVLDVSVDEDYLPADLQTLDGMWVSSL